MVSLDSCLRIQKEDNVRGVSDGLYCSDETRVDYEEFALVHCCDRTEMLICHVCSSIVNGKDLAFSLPDMLSLNLRSNGITLGIISEHILKSKSYTIFMYHGIF